MSNADEQNHEDESHEDKEDQPSKTRPGKVNPAMKSYIIEMSIAGYSCEQISEKMMPLFGIPLSANGVWYVRVQNIKKINRVFEDQLARARALQPLATLETRLKISQEVIDLARVKYSALVEMVVQKVVNGEVLTAEQRRMILREIPITLDAMNNAVRNASNDVTRMEALRHQARVHMAKMGTDDRDVVTEQIEFVERKVAKNRAIRDGQPEALIEAPKEDPAKKPIAKRVSWAAEAEEADDAEVIDETADEDTDV